MTCVSIVICHSQVIMSVMCNVSNVSNVCSVSDMCHYQGGNQYWMLSKTGEIRRDEACLDYAGADVILYPCHGSKGEVYNIYIYESSQIVAKYDGSSNYLESLTASFSLIYFIQFANKQCQCNAMQLAVLK